MSTSLGGSRGYGPSGQSAGLKGTGYKLAQTQTFTPEQMQLFSSMFGNVGPDSYLSRLAGGDQSQFAELEAPAIQQFQRFQGQLADRFTGSSGRGQLSSRGSSFQNAQNTAAQQFASQLQAQRMGLRNSAIQQLHQMSQDLLSQRPYQQYLYEPEQKQPAWQKLVGGSLPIIGAGTGAFFGGPVGAKIGGSIGSAAAQGFFS
jgi:hypothetical protein